MKADNTVTITITFDPKRTNRGRILDIPDDVVEAAKLSLKDGQRRVTNDPKEVAYYIIEPRNPYTEKAEEHSKCEDVTVYAVMKFKGYSFPKGSLVS